VTGLILAQASASAVVFTFENVATVPNDYASQLSVDVLDLGSGAVQFKFMNNGTFGGRIAGISFQDLDGLLSSQTLVEPSGVNFKSGGGANIPNSISFTEKSTFELTKDGAAANGIDPGQWLGVNFLGNYNNIIDSIYDGDLAMGLHVISIMPGGGSQKFINDIPPQGVPDGGSTLALLGGVALGLCALKWHFPREKKKRSHRSERVFFGPAF